MAAHALAVNPRERGIRLGGIYVILNDSPALPALARDVLDGGVRIVQYRAKSGIVKERLRRVRALTRERAALLVVNDDWQAALEFDCDGVHLGPDDEGFDRVAAVRARLGERLIGLSCGTPEEVRAANAAPVDYAGIGSVYATSSKDDAGAPIGVPALRALVEACALPVAAIGGITLARIPEIRASGAAMAAVISAVADSSDAKRAARALVDAWQR